MAKLSELLLDTNFLIECGKRRLLDKAKAKVPGVKLVTLQAVVDELEKRQENVALELIRSESIDVLPITGYADQKIFEYANEEVAVATNDKTLTEKLREKGIAVVFPTKQGCEVKGGIV